MNCRYGTLPNLIDVWTRLGLVVRAATLRVIDQAGQTFWLVGC